jgi:hypothetical protein
MAHAAEWGHWYDRQGNPVYEMPYAKGPGTRPVTLRDARKLGLVPGVSGISRCAAAPALERWKTEQVLLSALTLPRVDGEPMDALMERIRDDAQQQAEKARAKGTAIHAAIQGHYEGKSADLSLGAYINAAVNAINGWTSTLAEMQWESEKSFACPFGFGGKTDLRAYASRNMVYDPGLVADIKTKEFTGADLTAKKQLAWDEHCIQLAAYRVGLGMPKARCANVFVSVNEPGLAVVHEWPEEELERGWRMFLALLQYWQAKNKYNSSWLPEQKAA